MRSHAQPAAAGALATLRRSLQKQDDPYADADRAGARRFGGLVLAAQAALTAVFLSFAPPTEALGAWGWALAAVAVLGPLAAAAWLLLHGARVSDDELLGLSYLAVVAIGLLQWLAGGPPSPYIELALLWVVVVSASHPPRRVIAFMAFVVAVALSPLAYDPGASGFASDLAGRLTIWITLSAVIVARVRAFRSQRIGLGRREAEAETRAMLDPLTGLGNRRAFEQRLQAAIERARASGQALSLALFDLIGFKEINEGWGHLSGDTALRGVAAALRTASRGSDRAYRWGGDEFAIVFEGTQRVEALSACERIRSHVGRTCRRPSGAAIGVQFGTAELGPGMEAADLLAAADRALLAGKGGRAGRGALEPSASDATRAIA